MAEDRIIEKAKELGRFIGQTEEYGAMTRARKRLGEDEELKSLLERMETSERELAALLQQGEEPDEAFRERYEQTYNELQAHPAYQSLVAAQSNFDKVLARVNQAIGQGMEEGGTSRIILPR